MNLRSAAVAWIKSTSRDFNQGISILIQSGFKPAVVRKLSQVGPDGPEAPARLNFLIREFVSVFGKPLPEDTDPELHVFQGQDSPEDTPVKESRAILAVADKEQAQPGSVPPNIAAVIHTYATLYKKRAKACRQLADIPPQNTDELNSQRKQLSDAIEQITDRLEQLYPLYDRYLQSGQDINPKDIPSDSSNPSAQSDPSDPSDSSDPSTDLQNLSLQELRRQRRLLATKRTRTNNMLLYQQETRLPQPNPMPDSPAKVKYTRKLEKLNEEIQQLDYAIARHADN